MHTRTVASVSRKARTWNVVTFVATAVVLQLPAPTAVYGAVDTAQADSNDTELDEITVTATRRSESIESVPISITALNQHELDNRGVTTITDLTRLTPGLSLTQSGNIGTTNISIRGIASSVGAATTGIYIDDTPIQIFPLGAGQVSSNAYPMVFDLDRIEVLRGPQGTLFGAGSEGGTVRFITPMPDLENFSGFAKAGVGYTDGGGPGYEAGAAFGGPIEPGTVAFRVSGYDREDGGWMDRVPFPGTTVQERNSNSSNTAVANIAMTWAPTENLRITPEVYYQREKYNDTPQYWANLSNATAGNYVNGQAFATPYQDEFTLPSLRVSWDFGNGIALNSNTAYFNHELDRTGDYTYTLNELLVGSIPPPYPLAPVAFENPQKSFTQEIRLQSTDPTALFRWVVGAFYQKNRESAAETVFDPGINERTEAFYGETAQQAFGEGLLPGNIGYVGVDHAADQQKALYGQLDYRLTHTITLTAGDRLSRDTYTDSNFQNGPYNGGFTSASSSASTSASAPKFVISYSPQPGALYYVGAAKGFRPGGGNSPVSATRCAQPLSALGLTGAPASYGADYVWSYEAGTKLTTLNDRLEVNFSVYLINWSGIQSQVDLSGCGFNFITNLGRATSKGSDIDVRVRPANNLTAEITAGFTDAEYAETVLSAPLPDGLRAPVITDGDKLPVPPVQASVEADYSLPGFFARQGTHVTAGYEYNEGYKTRNPQDTLYDPIMNTYYTDRQLFAKVGASVSGWDLSLSGQNLLNTHEPLGVWHETLTSSLIRYVGKRPRTIWFDVSRNF